MFIKEHCISVSTSSGRTGYYPPSHSKETSAHYAISINQKEPEILSRLILDFIQAKGFECYQYLINVNDITNQPDDDLRRNIAGENQLKYALVVAGDKVSKTNILEELKAKWPDNYLLDTFPKNIYFMMGPDNYDGNYHVFFVHESCKELFWRVLIDLCHEFSLVLRYDPRKKPYLE